MAKDPKDVNPDLVRQEVEKGYVGDRELAKKPGKTPEIENTEEGAVWDDDQRQLVENQDMTEIEKAERKRPA
jgi:hypothetical protein